MNFLVAFHYPDFKAVRLWTHPSNPQFKVKEKSDVETQPGRHLR